MLMCLGYMVHYVVVSRLLLLCMTVHGYIVFFLLCLGYLVLVVPVFRVYGILCSCV